MSKGGPIYLKKKFNSNRWNSHPSEKHSSGLDFFLYSGTKEESALGKLMIKHYFLFRSECYVLKTCGKLKWSLSQIVSELA